MKYKMKVVREISTEEHVPYLKITPTENCLVWVCNMTDDVLLLAPDEARLVAREMIECADEIDAAKEDTK